MKKTLSIKEARELKRFSIEFVASKLKLDKRIIEDIEKGVKLVGIHSYYEKSYTDSIYKFLDIEIEKQKFSNTFQQVNNNTYTLIVIYFIIFIFFSLASLTNYIFFHFNNKSFNYFNYSDDQIMVLLKKNIKNSKIIFMDHSNFMDYLFLEKEYNKNNYLLIKSKPNRKSYYKIFYPNQNRESFGQLSEKNDLIVKYKKDIFIDISNIFSIDYIIFNGKKYKNSNENRYYLKNFDINKLNEL